MRTASAKKALLVIINTKSFQPQPQPQFPKEKKKEPEQNYKQFWTPSELIRVPACFALRRTKHRIAPVCTLKKASTTVVHSGALTITRSKWLPAFARSHWRRQDVAHADVKRDACARSRTKLCSAGGRTRDRTSCCTGTLTPTYEIVLGPLLPLKIKIQKINASSRIT